jgi:hypothetical protein
MKIFVSRQVYWGVDADNSHTVEIAMGGRDYANPDMLVPKYAGEGVEYTNPVKAVEAAIEIAKAWKNSAPGKTINIAYGNTLGFTMPFEPCEEKEIREWAQKVYNDLPKCSQCGELIEEKNHFTLLDYPDEKFCREYCAEKFLAVQQDAVEEEVS